MSVDQDRSGDFEMTSDIISQSPKYHGLAGRTNNLVVKASQDFNDMGVLDLRTNVPMQGAFTDGDVDLHNHNEDMDTIMVNQLAILPKRSVKLTHTPRITSPDHALPEVIKRKRANKVEEPLHFIPAPPPPTWEEGANKRKSVFSSDEWDVGPHKPRERHPLVKQTEEFLEKIEQNRKKEPQRLPSMEGIVFDLKHFSGNFNPELQWITKSAGSGSSGEVLMFEDIITRMNLTKKTIVTSGNNAKKFHKNEVTVPLEFDCLNLAKVFGIGWDGVQTILVMENAGMNMSTWVKEPQKLNHLKKLGVLEACAMDVLTGLAELALKNIAHCDLKPENVCILQRPDRPGQILSKIIDFGSTTRPLDPLTLDGITPEYLDPDFNAFYVKVMKAGRLPQDSRRRISPKDDVWAFGMLLLYIKFSGHPMILLHHGKPDYTQTPDMNRIRLSVILKISQMKTLPTYFKTYPDHPAVQELLPKALMLEERERWSAQRLKELLQETLTPTKRLKMMDVDEPSHSKTNVIPPLVASSARGVATAGIIKLKVTGTLQTCGPLHAPEPVLEDYSDIVMNMKQGSKTLVPIAETIDCARPSRLPRMVEDMESVGDSGNIMLVEEITNICLKDKRHLNLVGFEGQFYATQQTARHSQEHSAPAGSMETHQSTRQTASIQEQCHTPPVSVPRTPRTDQFKLVYKEQQNSFGHSENPPRHIQSRFIDSQLAMEGDGGAGEDNLVEYFLKLDGVKPKQKTAGQFNQETRCQTTTTSQSQTRTLNFGCSSPVLTHFNPNIRLRETTYSNVSPSDANISLPLTTNDNLPRFDDLMDSERPSQRSKACRPKRRMSKH